MVGFGHLKTIPSELLDAAADGKVVCYGKMAF